MSPASDHTSAGLSVPVQTSVHTFALVRQGCPDRPDLSRARVCMGGYLFHLSPILSLGVDSVDSKDGVMDSETCGVQTFAEGVDGCGHCPADAPVAIAQPIQLLAGNVQGWTAAGRHVKANLSGRGRGSSPGHPCHGGFGARSSASHRFFLRGLWWFPIGISEIDSEGGQ